MVLALCFVLFQMAVAVLLRRILAALACFQDRVASAFGPRFSRPWLLRLCLMHMVMAIAVAVCLHKKLAAFSLSSQPHAPYLAVFRRAV